MIGPVKSLELLSSRRIKDDGVLIHELDVLAGCSARRFTLSNSLPGSGCTLPRESAIIDVFPQLGVCLEVDDDVGFLARLIDDKSHALHESLLVFFADCIMKSIAWRMLFCLALGRDSMRPRRRMGALRLTRSVFLDALEKPRISSVLTLSAFAKRMTVSALKRRRPRS